MKFMNHKPPISIVNGDYNLFITGDEATTSFFWKMTPRSLPQRPGVPFVGPRGH